MAISQVSTDPIYDVIIIGGGPAGLAAALYCARDQAQVLLLEKGFYGGQISITETVENYPGVFSTSGAELTETMRKQAENFGALFETAEVQRIDKGAESVKEVVTDIGTFKSYAVIVASGATPRKAGFDGEEMFQGRGVSYCATCDGMFYRDKVVYVIGGGLAALEESIFLTNYVKEVHLIVRRDEFRAPLSVQKQVLANDKIKVHYNSRIKEVTGKFALESLVLEDTKTGEVTEEVTFGPGEVGIFVFVGYTPVTEILKDYADFDDKGGVIVDADNMTKTKGIYAAGDVCTKRLRQLVTAVSDGANAATAADKAVMDHKFEMSQA